MKYQIKHRDLLINGAIIGLAAGSIQTVYAVLMKFLHFTDKEFIDYGEVLIMGRDYPGTATIIGIVAHLINSAVWGVLFCYMIAFSREKYIILKSLGLGIFIWLFSLGLATLFKLSSFTTIPPKTSYILLAGAILWGLILGFTYKKIN